MTQGFVFYAPNVHTGGGFVLLQVLMATCPRDLQLTAVLDTIAATPAVLAQHMARLGLSWKQTADGMPNARKQLSR